MTRRLKGSNKTKVRVGTRTDIGLASFQYYTQTEIHLKWNYDTARLIQVITIITMIMTQIIKCRS